MLRTAGSFAVLTSENEPPNPSSIKTAYPINGQLPTIEGGFHAILI